MNFDARRRLIDSALSLIESGAIVAVPADDYFRGTTDDESFGSHMQTSRDIPIAEYAAAFRAVASRPDVHSVWVEIHELPDDSFPEERDIWPQAFKAFVITSAPAAQVESWLGPQEPRYADDEWGPMLRPADARKVPWPEPPPGMRAVLVEML